LCEPIVIDLETSFLKFGVGEPEQIEPDTGVEHIGDDAIDCHVLQAFAGVPTAWPGLFGRPLEGLLALAAAVRPRSEEAGGEDRHGPFTAKQVGLFIFIPVDVWRVISELPW